MSRGRGEGGEDEDEVQAKEAVEEIEKRFKGEKENKNASSNNL